MIQFDHERLDVYQAALKFLVLADALADSLPPKRANLADQLRGAATSIVLNTAEGAGEWEPAEKARFYRYAKRSATESAAAIDAAVVLKLKTAEDTETEKELLFRIVSMLVKMIRGAMPARQRPGTGTHTHTHTGKDRRAG